MRSYLLVGDRVMVNQIWYDPLTKNRTKRIASVMGIVKGFEPNGRVEVAVDYMWNPDTGHGNYFFDRKDVERLIYDGDYDD